MFYTEKSIKIALSFTPRTALTYFDTTIESMDSAIGIDETSFTSSEISFGYSYMGDNGTITLNRFFDKTKSWVKAGKESDYILKHEQGHFDLTEIYFRRLVKKTREHKFYGKTFKTEFAKIASTNSEELNKEQDTYDHETNHSIIEAKQKEWDGRIAARLKETESDTATSITIHLW